MYSKILKFINLTLVFVCTTTLFSRDLELTQEELAYINKQPIIRVANEYDWYPYSFYANGASGFAIDYIKLLASKVDLEVEFVTDTWENLDIRFRAGYIDILQPAVKTPEREEKFLFSKKFMTMRTSLIAKRKNSEIVTLEDVVGKKLAVVKGITHIERIKKNYPEIEILEFATSKEVLEAVAFGVTDAGIEDYFTANYLINKEMLANLHVASKIDLELLDNQSLHFVFKQSNKTLRDILDKALESTTSNELMRLRSKWLGNVISKRETPSNTVSLSLEEKEYLEEKEVIKMCIDPDWMPLEMNEDGKHIGMSADYMSLIERKINIPIRMVETKTWTESIEYAKARKCDIYSLAMETPERKMYMDFTSPYLSIPLVLVTGMNEVFYPDVARIRGQKIGIVKGYAYGEILRVKYPDMELVDVANIQDGLKKVHKGELFGFIGTLATIGYSIQRDYFGVLKIAGKFDETWELGIGVRNDEPLLFSSLEKAIQAIDKSKHQEILNKWISIKYEKETDYDLVYQVLIFFLVLMGIGVLRHYQLNKYNAKLEVLSTTDKLTSIYNRLKLDAVLVDEKTFLQDFIGLCLLYFLIWMILKRSMTSLDTQ